MLYFLYTFLSQKFFIFLLTIHSWSPFLLFRNFCTLSGCRRKGHETHHQNRNDETRFPNTKNNFFGNRYPSAYSSYYPVLVDPHRIRLIVGITFCDIPVSLFSDSSVRYNGFSHAESHDFTRFCLFTAGIYNYNGPDGKNRFH